jgi:hypothetical protein
MRSGAACAEAVGARALDPAAGAVVDVPGADAQAASTISKNASDDGREMTMADDAKILSAHASAPAATLPGALRPNAASSCR